MVTVDIDAKIPNNVDLAGDRRLQRALEAWQPKFVRWWEDLGPSAFKRNEVYLRTAIDVGLDGGPTSPMSRCPTTGGASFSPTRNPTEPSPSATTRVKPVSYTHLTLPTICSV